MLCDIEHEFHVLVFEVQQRIRVQLKSGLCVL